MNTGNFFDPNIPAWFELFLMLIVLFMIFIWVSAFVGVIRFCWRLLTGRFCRW